MFRKTISETSGVAMSAGIPINVFAVHRKSRRPNKIAKALLFVRLAATIISGATTLILHDFLIPYRTRNFVPHPSSPRPSAVR
ncbi:MAG: hypothetical protein NTW07_00645 [candidate division Zixibacteria bacterium]|nr:hypothetical protein [candidate division Zixibacteria bacterium]